MFACMAENCLISDEGGLLLASGSKDATVRLWKLSRLQGINELQEEQDASSRELKLKSITFEIPSLYEDISMCALLDTVLSGHEGLVSEVCWARPSLCGKSSGDPLFIFVLHFHACTLFNRMIFVLSNMFKPLQHVMLYLN